MKKRAVAIQVKGVTPSLRKKLAKAVKQTAYEVRQRTLSNYLSQELCSPAIQLNFA
jgi:hypothetical protein